jgi:hypothetical protein
MVLQGLLVHLVVDPAVVAEKIKEEEEVEVRPPVPEEMREEQHLHHPLPVVAEAVLVALVIMEVHQTIQMVVDMVV